MQTYQLVIAYSLIGAAVLVALVGWYKGQTRIGLAAGALAGVGLIVVTILGHVDPADGDGGGEEGASDEDSIGEGCSRAYVAAFQTTYRDGGECFVAEGSSDETCSIACQDLLNSVKEKCEGVLVHPTENTENNGNPYPFLCHAMTSFAMTSCDLTLPAQTVQSDYCDLTTQATN